MKVDIVFKIFGYPLTVNREVKEHISELSEKEYLTVMQYALGKISDKKIISSFFRLPPLISWLISVRKYWRYQLIDKIYHLADFTESADHFIVNHLPGSNLNCYSRRFKGISFMQFMFADTMYTQYLNSKNKNHLFAFMGSLYMKDNETFKDINIDERIEMIRKLNLPEYFITAVLINYMMQKKWLTKAFTYMFSDSEASGTSSHKQQQNWVQIFDAFVGEHIPDTEYYKNMPCMDAFRIINNRLKNFNKNGK